MCKKVTYCVMLKPFLVFQMEIVEEHIEPYMHFRGIPDKDTAIISFLNEYGWLIREMYCKKSCPKDCDVWEETIKFGHLKHKEVKDG